MKNKVLYQLVFIAYGVILTVVRYILIRDQEIKFDPYDSIYYFDFKIFNAFRLPIITGIYSLIENYESIVLFQSLFSSLSWILLMSSALTLLSNQKSKILLIVLLSGLSISNLVIFRDYYLLGESLTLSSFLILVASFILFFQKSSLLNLSFFLVALLLFSGIKTTNTLTVLIFILLLLPIFLLMWHKKVLSRYSFILLLLFLAIFSNFLHSSLSSEVTSQLNTSSHINLRIWTNPDWRAQLLDSGYPPELRTIWKDRTEYNLGETPDQGVVNEAIYQSWWDSSGKSFLLNFMIKNPSYTFIGPFFLPFLNSNTNFSYTLFYGLSQDPNFFAKTESLAKLTNLYWPETRSLSYLALAIIFFLIGSLLFILTKFPLLIKNLTLMFFLFLFTITWSYISWWFGSKPPSDILRHQESAAILIRVLAILSASQLIDIYTRKRKLI